MPRERKLSLEDFEHLAVGAWILGTGGGGDPHHGLLNIRRLLAEGRTARLVDAMELGDEDLVGVCGQMGAPLVSQERITDPAMIAGAVERMERYLGRPFAALMTVEIGGGNALQPFLAGAVLDRPVVDGDTMGRAFPAVQHSSFSVGDLPITPCSMLDIRGNELLLVEAEDWVWAERITRRVCMEWGSRAFNVKGPRTGREVRDWAILGTVSRAIELGVAVRSAQSSHEDPVQAVLAAGEGKALLRGKVVDVRRRMSGGYLWGKAELEGLDADAGGNMSIEFQNEFLVAWRDGYRIASVPELICLLDSESGEAVGSETLRYGQRVTAIVLPAPSVYLSERGLECAGPKAFGYDLAFETAFADAAALHTADGAGPQ